MSAARQDRYENRDQNASRVPREPLKSNACLYFDENLNSIASLSVLASLNANDTPYGCACRSSAGTQRLIARLEDNRKPK